MAKAGDVRVRELQSRARREGAEANVEFLGFVEQQCLPELCRKADVFLFALAVRVIPLCPAVWERPGGSA